MKNLVIILGILSLLLVGYYVYTQKSSLEEAVTKTQLQREQERVEVKEVQSKNVDNNDDMVMVNSEVTEPILEDIQEDAPVDIDNIEEIVDEQEALMSAEPNEDDKVMIEAELNDSEAIDEENPEALIQPVVDEEAQILAEEEQLRQTAMKE